MKKFDYYQPETLKEAYRLMEKSKGGAKYIAGGTDLIGNIKKGVIQPDALVSLKRIKELSGTSQNKDLVLGSMTLWRHLGPFSLLAWLPLPFARHFPRRKFLMFSLAAAMLGLPYLQSTGVLHLLVHPIGWTGWLAQIGWLFPAVGTLAFRLMVIVPLAVYGRLLFDLLSDLNLIPRGPSRVNSE